LVLVILAVIWAAVLLPPFIQHRSESRPADSISTFRNQLSVLERRAMAAPGATPTRQARAVPAGAPRLDRARLARLEAKKRRRDILVTLLAAAGLTLVLGLALPQVLLLHLVIDLLLVAYVALLVRQRRIVEERAMKVRYLRAPVANVRRSAVPAAAGRYPAVSAPAARSARYVTAPQPQPQLALRRTAGG
jgi:hypothetical protein